MKDKASNLFGEMLAFRTTHLGIFSQKIKVNNGRAANKRENFSALTLKRDKGGLEVIGRIDDISRNVKMEIIKYTST